MARYRKIYPRFWVDPDVRRLDPLDKLVALYCLSGPQTNRIGLYTFSMAAAADDIGVPVETFRERFGNVIGGLNWQFDAASRILFLPKWWRWNTPENPNVLAGALKDLDDLPETPLLSEFMANLGDLPETFAERIANVTETLAKRMRNQEQEQEQEQEQYRKDPNGSFCPDLSGDRSGPPELVEGPPTEVVDDVPSGYVFPVVGKVRGKSVRTWTLQAAKVDEYGEVFPDLDIAAELRKAVQWCRDNPTKRKTPRGMLRFLNGWFDRAQNSAGVRRGDQGTTPAKPRVNTRGMDLEG